MVGNGKVGIGRNAVTVPYVPGPLCQPRMMVQEHNLHCQVVRFNAFFEHLSKASGSGQVEKQLPVLGLYVNRDIGSCITIPLGFPLHSQSLNTLTYDCSCY